MNTINLTPSWKAAVRIYCAVLLNPKAIPIFVNVAGKVRIILVNIIPNRIRRFVTNIGIAVWIANVFLKALSKIFATALTRMIYFKGEKS